MSKPLLYAVNQSSQNIAVDSAVGLGGAVRRCGCELDVSGNSVLIEGSGYYNISLNVVCAPSATGNVTVTLYEDGVAIPGATATMSVSTANNIVTIPINDVVIRQCCCNPSRITCVLTGTASTVTNVTITVKKI